MLPPASLSQAARVINTASLNSLQSPTERPALSQEQFEENLRQWIDTAQPGAGEQRELAAERIRDAYKYHSTALNLNNLKLTSLPENTFTGLTNLQKLDLRRNHLTTLAANTFAGLTNLQSLYLTNNPLSTLAANTFAGLTNLQKLYLSYNQLTTLADNTFAELTNLQTLDLGYNRLTTLADHTFARLKNLEELSLQSNELTTLAENIFAELTNLQSLYLTNNLLSTLAANTFAGLTNLQKLYLSYNQLTTLADNTFAGLTNLQKLDLGYNRLTTLAENIFAELTNLQQLNLSQNRLTTLTANTFAGLTNLQQLHLNTNKLTTLADNAFTRLKNLEELSLQSNELTTLPENAFAGLTKLESLNLGDNQFIFLPTVPTWVEKIISGSLKTIEEEFKHGNTHLLNFLLNGEQIPGTTSEHGIAKLNIMLEYADKKIADNKQFSLEYSSTLNQLFYQASVLDDYDRHNQAVKNLADSVLPRYLDAIAIKPFVAQAEYIGMDPSRYEDFVFITADGKKGLTINKVCYEVNILDAPFADRNHPNASLANGMLIHDIDAQEASFWKSAEDLKSFPLFNEAYKKVLANQGIDALLNSLNMDTAYKQRFLDVITFKSIGALASARGRTPEEKTNLLSYKMIDPTSTHQLFTIFYPLIQNETISPNSSVEEFRPNNHITLRDQHFSDICKVFSNFSQAQHGALLFALATLFVRYSSQTIFGTADDSPAPIRWYAVALLNKLHELNPILFMQVKGTEAIDALINGACTDGLTNSMQAYTRNYPTLKPAYEQIMPEMWQ